MTSADSFTAAADQARAATERSVEVWKRGAKTITDQADLVAKMPTIDLTEPVTRYFEYVQRTVDLNRDLAIKWAELVTSFTGVLREQAEAVSHLVEGQTEKVADLAGKQAEKGEQTARELADKPEQAEREMARKARAAECEQARLAHEKAREPYEGLSKAKLSDKLTERDLPKTGTVEELIERLASADSE
jgi:hypothetical protein